MSTMQKAAGCHGVRMSWDASSAAPRGPAPLSLPGTLLNHSRYCLAVWLLQRKDAETGCLSALICLSLCPQTRVPTSQLQAQGQMQASAPQPAQVALAKPPVVSVPAAVVSSPGVTTLPMNVAGISVAIGQPQKATGACLHGPNSHAGFRDIFHGPSTSPLWALA